MSQLSGLPQAHGKLTLKSQLMASAQLGDVWGSKKADESILCLSLSLAVLFTSLFLPLSYPSIIPSLANN